MPKPDEQADLFEIMYSCRSMRRLKPDPVPDEVIEKLIDAAVQCPSGSNAQNWRFVVVRDRSKLEKIQKLWQESWAFYEETISAAVRPGENPEQLERQRKASRYMINHMHEVPALIFVCAARDEVIAEAFASPATILAAVRNMGLGNTLNLVRNATKTGVLGAGGAAYPAVQNLLLAARALGLGAVLTTPHVFQPGEYEKIIGVPPEVTLCAIIPVGYPKGKFGPVKRPPVSAVLDWDTYSA